MPDAVVRETYILKAVVYGQPQALLFKEPAEAELRAAICADCGHVTLWCPEAERLYAVYERRQGQGGR